MSTNKRSWLIIIDNGNTEEIHAYENQQTSCDAWALFTLMRKDRGYFSMKHLRPSGAVHQKWEAHR